MASDYRPILISELDTMRKADIAQKKVHQVRAYSKVIEQLKAMPSPVTSFEDVKDLQGAGEKIKAKMKEILETGSLKAASEARQSLNLDAFEILQGIHGVGPVKAKELIASGIKTIAQLRDALAKDETILNDVQKMGLKYYEDSQGRIPRAEMEMHEKRILSDLDDSFQAVVVGSYRRGLADSGDIDVLMTLPSSMTEARQKELFVATVTDLKKKGYIVDTLAQGPKKFLGYVRVNEKAPARRLDLLMTPPSEFAYAILYFTGSQNFNVAFRRHAQEKGYTINEHTMKSTREGVPSVPPMKTEADIFAFLNLEFVEPPQRKGALDVKERTPAPEAPKKKRVLKIAKPVQQTLDPK